MYQLFWNFFQNSWPCLHMTKPWWACFVLGLWEKKSCNLKLDLCRRKSITSEFNKNFAASFKNNVGQFNINVRKATVAFHIFSKQKHTNFMHFLEDIKPQNWKYLLKFRLPIWKLLQYPPFFNSKFLFHWTCTNYRKHIFSYLRVIF